MSCSSNRLILHVDVDAFFASVEQLLIPSLRGRPVAVGNGVIASCSYEARAQGLHAAMSLRQARRHCPELVILDGNYQIYRCFAEHVWAVCRRYVRELETFLDEAYGDATGMEGIHGPPDVLGRRLQLEARDRVGLPVTVGLAANRMLAKLASRSAKPLGVRWLRPEQAADFLAPLPVDDLLGVGPKTARKLRDINVRTVADLRRVPRRTLQCLFGARGDMLYDRCRGEDPGTQITPTVPPSHVIAPFAPRRVYCEPSFDSLASDPCTAKAQDHRFCDDVPASKREKSHAIPNSPCEEPADPCFAQGQPCPELEQPCTKPCDPCAEQTGDRPRRPRTISRETTFHEPECDPKQVAAMLAYLAGRAMRAVREGRLLAGCVEVTVRYDDWKHYRMRTTLAKPTDVDEPVFATAQQLLARVHTRRVAVRHVGVVLSKFTPASRQLALFDADAPTRDGNLCRALDAIRDRWGHGAIVQGRSIRLLGELEQNDYGFLLRTPSLTK